jgi:hypothetical protein
MSRSDWWSIAVTLVLSGLAYFIGAPRLSIAALVVGLGIGIYLHKFPEKHEEKVSGPQPCLEYSARRAEAHMTFSGLSVRNCGDKSAFRINLTCEPVGNLRLRFEDIPIQRIDPGDTHPVQVRTEEFHGKLWHSVGGTLGMQIESLFERLDGEMGTMAEMSLDTEQEHRFPVTINFTDYDGKKEQTSRWVIVRKGHLFLTKRIYCEMAPSN